ncbi:hypothetical protein [Marinobacter xestospongiae]|uniref:Immunity protein 22 n=1 Tax=Marinobacter xestospongiae TaxID=994319 RepID=A0ABU3VYM5_9GAMM|nr:hypothetical protein [Marinobacter xestospongiae]MDV2079383.1 hypothetical protein [Marinobacter xestospongiae]
MRHLSEFFQSAANLLEYPEDLDRECFVVYEIALKEVSLKSALKTFNETNPLEKWDWPFDLGMDKYKCLESSEAVSYLKHFIGDHLRYENGAAIDEEHLENLALVFLQGEWDSIYVNHGSVTRNSCGFSIVRCPECHESFMALMGSDRVRILSCWESD